jgi:hypothetical protein
MFLRIDETWFVSFPHFFSGNPAFCVMDSFAGMTNFSFAVRFFEIIFGITLVNRLIKEYISCYGGDCDTTGKTPVVRNDIHFDYL